MSFCCTSDRLLAGGADRHDQKKHKGLDASVCCSNL